MGQINLYKIDVNKKEVFCNKLDKTFEFIGKKDYNLLSNKKKYTVGAYINISDNKKILEWQWILDEYNFDKVEISPFPKAVLLIENRDNTYAVTYGASYFIADKFCDIDFAFDFARKINFKQIKTTTLTLPNAQRNKTINIYLNYNDISFDSGESYAKIKAKADIEEGIIARGEIVEIGHSIKTKLPENSINSILKFLEFVENTRCQKELHKIPIFSKVKDENMIKELDESLLNRIEESMECINISELDIIGATEIFNTNDATFILRHKRKRKDLEELSKENIIEFLDENGFTIKEDFLNIKVVSNKNGQSVCTNEIKKLIDYTDDDKRCLLLKGEWYYFNDDYVKYLQDSIAELDVIYNSQYDFSDRQYNEYLEEKFQEERAFKEYNEMTEDDIRKRIKNKYYAERVYNNILSEKFGYKNYDRNNDEIEAGRIELMDLYKDKTMFAVKIGNSSSKLSYVVEQSISSTRAYKHRLLSDMPEIVNIAVWIILKYHQRLPIINEKPDISKLKMVMFKNRLDAWKKEVRLLGYKPIVYLNYWEQEKA